MFTKDSRTETFLTQMGVAFKYTNSVTFAELVIGWDTTNLARPEPRNETAIVQYAELMENGSPAPATILHLTDNGYEVLDGVQRLAAADLGGFTKLSAYAVTCDSDDILAVIRVLANARLQGHAEPPEWTRKRAVEVLVVQRGLSVKEVAKMGGWKPADIEKTARVLEWGFKIRCMGGPQLPDNMVDTISRHTTQDEITKAAKPIAEFLNTIKKAQFSNGDAEPYIKEFFCPITKASRTHEIYTERLAEFMDEPEVQTRVLGRRGHGLSRDVNLRRTLKTAVTVLDEIVDAGDDVPYVDEFFKLLKSIDEKLRRVAKHHEQPTTADVPADMWRDNE